jgi:hypothetical protein
MKYGRWPRKIIRALLLILPLTFFSLHLAAQDALPAAPSSQKSEDNSSAASQPTGVKKELVRLRDWESGWFTGSAIPKTQPMVPITSEMRWHYYLQQTLTTPGAYFKRMFAAGIDQARGAPSQWDGGMKGYGERFASREGQFITANSLAAIGNAALHYEVRYDLCRCSGFWPRTRHAVVRNFITYNRELQRRPQWGLYGGSFGGGVVSSTWKPDRNPLAEGGRAMAGQVAYGALLNFFIEFAGDINRKLGAKQ